MKKTNKYVGMDFRSVYMLGVSRENFWNILVSFFHDNIQIPAKSTWILRAGDW